MFIKMQVYILASDVKVFIKNMNCKINNINFQYYRYLGPVKEDGEELMAIFASEFGIEMLKKAPIIAVDGTFSTCPSPWCQLFVIQAVVEKGTSYPVVYGLLPNKCASTYLKFFTEVANLSEDMFKGKFDFKSYVIYVKS